MSLPPRTSRAFAALLVAAAVAAPLQAQAGEIYRGWGAGPIGVVLVKKEGPVRGVETNGSQQNQVKPTEQAPIPMPLI
jgi:hypothetical protein